MRRRLGAGPLYFVGHAVFFVVAYLAVRNTLEFATSHTWNWLAWFVGAALLHDLVFLPFYALPDGVLSLQEHPWRRVRLVNHLRVPAVVSGVMLLVFAPSIFAKGQPAYTRTSGDVPPDYLGRWAAITVGLFAASAVVYGVRWIRASRRPRAAAPASAAAPSRR